MANTLYIPFLCATALYEMEPNQLPQYLSTHMDDYLFSNQQKFFNTPGVKYYQKWMTYDSIGYQFQSNFASIQAQLIDCDQNVITTVIAIQKRINKYLSGYYAYELNIPLASIPEGVYFIKFNLGGGSKFMISEPQEINNNLDNTLLFEYYNSRYHGDVIFETGIVFMMRMEAKLCDFDPGNERTAYRDQRLNPSTLNSIPFRTWELKIGPDFGVPDWVGHKLNWIFSCDNVSIDGKPYAVFEESKIEAVEIDPAYPMRIYTLQIQEGINRASKIVGIDIDPNQKIIVGSSIDDTLFGSLDDTSGQNIINILDVE